MHSQHIRNINLDDIFHLRHQIHQAPSLSGQEESTVNMLKQWFSSFNCLMTPICQGRGLLVIFNHGIPGKTILLRAETDALPIQTVSKKKWASRIDGVSHACGHDGHAATMASLAQFLDETPFPGKVVLLFQPDEERGLGAASVINEVDFNNLNPDLIFGFHNLPGFPLNRFVVKDHTFTAASCGLKIKLSGKTAHASTPHTGISPALAVADLIQSIPDLSSNESQSTFKLITLTHAKIGEEAWGIAPGDATVCFTLRTYTTPALYDLKQQIIEIVKSIAKQHTLEVDITEHDFFNATINHTEAYSTLISSLNALGSDFIIKEEPFPWSEDFGHYTDHIKGCFFGIGAGLSHPALHSPDYDYPDETIPTMHQFLITLLEQCWKYNI